jgi:hypothetical protein
VDDQEIKLLGQISQGVVIFEPYARTSAELTRFQEMARKLLKMEGEGLIHKCLRQRGRNRRGQILRHDSHPERFDPGGRRSPEGLSRGRR